MDESAQLSGFTAAADIDNRGIYIESVGGAKRFLPDIFGRFTREIFFDWVAVDSNGLVGLFGFDEFNYCD